MVKVRKGQRVLTGEHLTQVALPMGGIGAGSISLTGHGALTDWSLHQKQIMSAATDGGPASGWGAAEAAFGVLHIKNRGGAGTTRLLEGPLPLGKIYDQGLQAQGYRKSGYEGLPRFSDCEFTGAYPFGEVRLWDKTLPVEVTIRGWSPLIPGDEKASGIPAIMLEYEFRNTSRKPVTFNFAYNVGHLAVGSKGDKESWNEVLRTEQAAGVVFRNTEHPHHDAFGSAAFAAIGRPAKIRAMWFRGGWFDGISTLWRELAAGKFTENNGCQPGKLDGRNGGSILVEGNLKPGERLIIPIIIAWYFPNTHQEHGTLNPTPAPAAASACCGGACTPAAESVPPPTWRPWYAGQWKDAADVASYVAHHYESLRCRTLAFKNALFSTTAPSCILDAVSANLAILKSLTIMRQESGNLWAWEGVGCNGGCCHGSCTHVWNYAQALPHLFPGLERTLREQEFDRSMDERGHVNFRAALPDGPTKQDFHAAADGQLGGIMKLYRDWHITGDTPWMQRLYPKAKLSLDYGIATWDPDHKGGLFEPHHNTYDIEFWGPDGMCGSIYVGALAALAAMAKALGYTDDEKFYGDLSQKAAKFLDTKLFNGEYYQQNVTWKGLRNESFANLMKTVTAQSNEMLRLQKAEGPKYQYGKGCLSDGIIGGWMAKIYGIPTTLRPENIRQTLHSIHKYNFKPDLWDHIDLQRPGYALGHEGGLVLCTWPQGGQLTLPFVYSDEVWTGIEYQVASHLIAEGMVKEGVEIVEAARARYEGKVRNPWNEYE
ncbi:MAG: GH116 family glycosyl hydrolase, partial [Phycisphaerae bacterium]